MINVTEHTLVTCECYISSENTLQTNMHGIPEFKSQRWQVQSIGGCI